MPGRRSIGKLAALGLAAAAAAYALASALRPWGLRRARPGAAAALATDGAAFELDPAWPQLRVRGTDGVDAYDVGLALVVDGAPHPIVPAHRPPHADPDALSAAVPLVLDDVAVDVQVELRRDAARDAIAIVATAPPGALVGGHAFALRAEVPTEGQAVFVSGIGQLADRATVAGGAVVVGLEPRPLAVASPSGPITVESISEEALAPGEPVHLTATSPAGPAASEQLAEIDVVLGRSSAAVWRSLAEIEGTPTATVRGRVTGTPARSIVVGRDDAGRPQVRALAGEGGAFALDVPASVVDWYATVDPGQASRLTPFVPGSPGELVLDVTPGGTLRVTVVDADTRAPLTARLMFRGVDGAVDPNFGPDYRASGAGPIIDSLRGDVATPMPSGRYRVMATKGIEWSVDEKVVDVVPGGITDVTLAPRHVVPTPGMLGCDLHVHARPSFDAPVTPEDRVLSLAAAGIDFAVPTEHNVVGDYSPAIRTLDLGREMLTVPGVEVTTLSKGFGHFGVFPYPPAAPVPPFLHTNMAAVFRAVRSGDKHRYFQLNHPRLPGRIGYFDDIGFDPRAPLSRLRGRFDFDGIEVYNGYDNEYPERIERVMHDYFALLDFGWRYTATGSSDSHRIQFHWAGYPRTMVTVDPAAPPASDAAPIDPLAVVANIMKGHATVTNGPLVDAAFGGSRPGDEIDTAADPVHGHVRVRAAPWIDVTRVEIVAGHVGGTYGVVQTFDVPSRPTRIGPEEGTLDEVQAKTIRFDRDVDVPMGPGNGWIVVIARGTRRMDDVLAFMPLPPLAFTNPVYVVRRPAPPPPFPGGALPRGVPPR